MIDFTSSDMRPRFAEASVRMIAKGRAAMAAFSAERDARAARLDTPTPAPQADDTAYPAGWLQKPQDTHKPTFGAPPAADGSDAYPAHWRAEEDQR